MDISLDNNVHTANTIELNLFILVVSPVTHADEVGPAGVVLLVAFRQNGVRIQSCPQSTALVGLDPGVVVNCSYVLDTVYKWVK